MDPETVSLGDLAWQLQHRFRATAHQARADVAALRSRPGIQLERLHYSLPKQAPKPGDLVQRAILRYEVARLLRAWPGISTREAAHAIGFPSDETEHILRELEQKKRARFLAIGWFPPEQAPSTPRLRRENAMKTPDYATPSRGAQGLAEGDETA